MKRKWTKQSAEEYVEKNKEKQDKNEINILECSRLFETSQNYVFDNLEDLNTSHVKVQSLSYLQKTGAIK